ncbi:hypothetical protein [Micromonospora sp. NPDC005174]
MTVTKMHTSVDMTRLYHRPVYVTGDEVGDTASALREGRLDLRPPSS